MVRTGTATTPIYERTIYIDGVFEYVILEDTSGTYEKNYIHIMDDKSRIAEVRIGTPFPNDIADDITYTLENNIGSSVARLDINGTVIDREEYYPFGDSSLRTFTYKRYRYVGKERDQESGLYYYGARYYAAWTCRFISVDPLSNKYPQLTPYNYANQNPINDFDIDGMQDTQTESPVNNNKVGEAAPILKEIAKETKKPVLDQASKELAKKGAEKAAENGGKALAKENISPKGFKLGGLLRGLLLAVIHELATSPKIDDVAQFKRFYRSAELKEFADPKANAEVAFWAKRIDWVNVDPNEFKDIYLYRAMETRNGKWIKSDLNGAPNGRELGARTPSSNKGSPDVYPDSNDSVSPNFKDPKGLSTNLFPLDTAPQMERIKGEGAIGKISIKTLLSMGIIPTFDPSLVNPGHFVLQPAIQMKFAIYQTILNSLPWQVFNKK